MMQSVSGEFDQEWFYNEKNQIQIMDGQQCMQIYACADSQTGIDSQVIINECDDDVSGQKWQLSTAWEQPSRRERFLALLV